MKKLTTIVSIALFILTLLASCGSGGLEGTYVACNEAAKQTTFAKFVFSDNEDIGGDVTVNGNPYSIKGKKNTVKIYVGMMGIAMPIAYECSYSLKGDKLIITEGIPGVSGGSFELTYNKEYDEISMNVDYAFNMLGEMFGAMGGKNTFDALKNNSDIRKKATPVWRKEGTFNPNDPCPEQKDTDKGDNSTYPNNSNNKGGSEKPRTFTYSGGNVAKNLNGNFKTDYSFSTNYFDKSANEYNHKLSIMSLQLAMAAFGLHNVEYGDNKANNIKELLLDMGFQDIKPYGYDKKPTTNSIAVTFARKSLKSGYELLVIAVRGGEYGNEWGGDFNIGNGEVHEGFNIAKDDVKDYFDKYLLTYKDSLVDKKGEPKNVKLWITGYSRGAAVANLLSAYFVDRVRNNGIYGGMAYIDNNNTLTQVKLLLKPHNIYTYGFATPNVFKPADSTESTKMHENYQNIFSVVSPFDIVPKVPFEFSIKDSWGFKKFGRTKTLPNSSDSKYNNYEKNMLIELNKIDVTSTFKEHDYFINKFKTHKGNTGNYHTNNWVPIVNILDQIDNVAIYDLGPHDEGREDEKMDKYLDHVLQNLMVEVFGTQKNYVDKIQDLVTDALGEGKMPSGFWDGFWVVIKTGNIGNVANAISKTLFSGKNNDDIATLGPSDEHLKRIKSGDFNVGNLLLSERFPAVYNKGEGWFNGKEDAYEKIMKEKGITREKAIEITAEEGKNNFYAIISGHYPELYLAWLKSLPEEYFL